MEKSLTMPDTLPSTVDTPRTSNLKFLRAKRLSYFCGKSSQSVLSSTETPRSVTHRKQQSPRSQTPSRCLSAPILKENRASSTSTNARTQKAPFNDKAVMQPAEANVMSTPSEIQETGLANKSTIKLTVHQHLPPAPKQVEPNSYHLQTSKVSSSETSTSDTPQQSLTELQVHGCLDNQYTLPTTSKETSNTAQSKQNVQTTIENESSKVMATQDLLQEHMEQTITSPSYYPVLEQSEDHLIHNHQKSGPELETNGQSTHRSLLRSSFASDLDKGLLNDTSVPESEKLQYVMTWAKKFLGKCNVDVLPCSDGTPSLSTLDEKDSAFGSYETSSTVDTYIKVNSPRDSRVKNNTKAKHETIKKQSYLSQSPRNLDKIYSDFKNVSKTNEIGHVVPPKVPTLNYRDRPMSPSSGSDHRDYKYTKPLTNMYPHMTTDQMDTGSLGSFDNSLREFVDFKGKDYSDDDDLFGNQANYSMGASRITAPDDKEQHIFIAKEEDTSSSESGLDTERLNTLLENLEQIQKVTELKTQELERDGSRTNRTFLVKNSLDTADTAIPVSNNNLGRVHPSSYKTYKERNLLVDSTPRTYRVCTVCSFSNITNTSWCEECGSVLSNDRAQISKPDTANNLPTVHTAHVVDDFLSLSNRTFKDVDEIPTVKQMDRGDKSASCWEDNSDEVTVSDSDGSVLEKYFHYVKKLDLLKKTQKQSESWKGDHSHEISSDEESYEEPQKNTGVHNYYLAKPDFKDDASSDEGGIEFLQDTSQSGKPYISHLDQKRRPESQLRRSSENNYKTDIKLKSSIGKAYIED